MYILVGTSTLIVEDSISFNVKYYKRRIYYKMETICWYIRTLQLRLIKQATRLDNDAVVLLTLLSLLVCYFVIYYEKHYNVNSVIQYSGYSISLGGTCLRNNPVYQQEETASWP